MAELSYRPLDPADLPAFLTLVSDWEVVRQLGSWPWPPDPDFTASRCKPYEGDGFVWGIFRDGRLIGTVGVTGGVLGYCLEMAQAGQGIATRAARQALAQAFADPSLLQVIADVWADNPASARVLAKCGFVETGRAVTHAKARNAPTLSIAHVLTRRAWDALRTAAR
jgi:RimJ/RimL family protein N-acetyltransferase